MKELHVSVIAKAVKELCMDANYFLGKHVQYAA